ncbi:MAG TPA: CBASS oligonucleotide cyclase [Haliangium sp.]|nr:CBASS oligonucleotide cyclase [Haliangium sp.]
MAGVRSVLHRRFSCFVEWLAPDVDKEDDIRKQANDIRERVKGQAERDGLVIRSTPSAGSFAKRTGLRRHITGGSDVEGLDVDLPFVVSPRTRRDEELTSLLDRFERYAAATYPSTERERTRSAVRLRFKAARLSYELVPMLATEDRDRQILIRASGERVETSVQKHVDFVRRRTQDSNELPGRVKFNECVRLLKWWREFRIDHVGLPEPLRPSSMLIELLCAHAYDALRVEATYATTLLRWLQHMASAVRGRTRVVFADFVSPAELERARGAAEWDVLDPVNPSNNIVARWSRQDIDKLSDWLTQACSDLDAAMRASVAGKDAESLRHLVALFGTPFKHHCGDT